MIQTSLKAIPDRGRGKHTPTLEIRIHIYIQERERFFLTIFEKDLLHYESECASHSVLSPSLQPHGAHQAPLSMGLFRQEYWSGLPLPCLGDLPSPGVEPGPPALQRDFLPVEPPGKHPHHTMHVFSVAKSCLTLCNPTEPTRLLCPWDFPGKNTGMLPFPSPGDLPDSGILPLLHLLQWRVDSWPLPPNL